MCPQRPLHLRLTVYLALAQAGHEFVGFKVNQLHLIGPVKNTVGYAFAHNHAGEGGHNIIKAFNVLHVDRCPYGYARL